jgi:hypothetical protein
MNTKMTQLSWCRITFLVICFISFASFVYATSDTLYVEKCTTVPIIDGDEDYVWNSIEVIDMNEYILLGNLTLPSNDADLSCKFRTMWDNQHFYLLINIIDDLICNTGTWEGDRIELFFDGDNSKTEGTYDGINDIQLAFLQNLNGHEGIVQTYPYPNWGFDESLIVYCIKTTENGWNLELSLFLSELKITPSEGSLFGFEIQYGDNDSGEERNHVVKWYNGESDDSWCDASTFGTAKLLGPKNSNDIGVVSIKMDSVLLINNAQNIKISIKNYGLEMQSNFQIGYQIDTSNPVTEIYNNSISFDETVEYTFQTPWIPDQVGATEITVFTNLTSDENSHNDRSSKTVKVACQNDVGISEIQAASSVGINRPFTIRVKLINDGIENQSNFPVDYRIDSDNWITETYSGTLKSQQTIIYNFTNQWTPTSLGSYQITAKTSLSGDQNAKNDTKQKNVTVVNAAYMGAWEGTSSQNNRPLYIHVNDKDEIDSISVEIRVNFGSDKCTYLFSNSGLFPIENDTFQVDVFGAIFIPVDEHYPIVHGEFTSQETCLGTISEFIAAGGYCNGKMIIGTGCTNSSQTWSADRTSYTRIIIEKREIIQEQYSLSQNYPNPFNPSTTIGFDIPELKDGFMNARVIIYNILGQKIKTLLNRTVEAGHFELEWDGTNELNQLVPSGIYIYQFQSDLFYASKKMVFMR